MLRAYVLYIRYSVLHRLLACAAGLQAAGSTVGSKEPNILANYLRAQPGFDE
jgi:hypothetical protein